MREAMALSATLGGAVRVGRRARRWRQRDLGAKVGMSQSQVSKVERGLGGSLPLSSWVALGLAVGRPLRVDLSRPVDVIEPMDAGHLAAQEWLLRLIASHGWRADFELPTRPQNPSRSIDVAARDVAGRRLLVLEVWNRITDIGASVRASTRKRAEADALAATMAGEGDPYRVTMAWLIRPTAANRGLLRAYPAILRSRFPGSSVRWVAALSSGSDPPAEPGVMWIDPASGRLSPVRLRPD